MTIDKVLPLFIIVFTLVIIVDVITRVVETAFNIKTRKAVVDKVVESHGEFIAESVVRGLLAKANLLDGGNENG